MLKTRMNLNFNWQKWQSSEEELKCVPPELASRMLFDIFLINGFEYTLLDLQEKGLLRGPVHTSIGQESIAAATVAALSKSDQTNGTHRAHHHFLAKAMQYVLPSGWSPISENLPVEGEEVLQRTLAEIIGLAPGYCGGKGGSMHLRYAEAGFIGSNAVVGGGIPIATGAAFAEKYNATGNIVMTFLGDGASNQGTFHEACNLAAAFKLPIIYFIENNSYAEATRIETAAGFADLSVRAAAYGMDGYIVDGYDPLAIYEVVKQAKENILAGSGPCIIEGKTYRHYDHMGGQTGSEAGYRSREEEEEWLRRDAYRSFPIALIKAGILTETQIGHIKEMVKESLANATTFCLTTEEPRSVREELWPKPEMAYQGLRSDGHEWREIKFSEKEQFTSSKKVLYREAMADVITHWFEKSPNVVYIGEEVSSPGSILHSANEKFAEKYAAQIFNTPISEAGFVGLSCGAAMLGMRPIVEIMYSNFSLVAADQLFSQIAKTRYLYGNTVDLPIVVRNKVTLGFGYGEHHSMNPVGLYALFPGWRIVAPSNAFDYIGLFNSAMQSLDPVLIVEFKALYEQTFEIPDGDVDYFIPLGKANVVRAGQDVTVITYSAMVGRCEKLCADLAVEGISADLIDLRTVDLPGIDYDTIGESIQKTQAVVIVEEAAVSQGICKTIAANITERFFEHLKGPVACVTGADVNPVSQALESLTAIQDQDIYHTIISVVKQNV